MARVGRPGMSDAAKRELWDRWARGESISEIARALAKPPGSVFAVLKSNGGYVPPVRTRRAGTLTAADREEISRGLGRGDSVRQSARALGRPPSTVSREIARNKGRSSYRAVELRSTRPTVLAGPSRACWPKPLYFGSSWRRNWDPRRVLCALLRASLPGAGTAHECRAVHACSRCGLEARHQQRASVTPGCCAGSAGCAPGTGRARPGKGGC